MATRSDVLAHLALACLLDAPARTDRVEALDGETFFWEVLVLLCGSIIPGCARGKFNHNEKMFVDMV